MVCIGVEMNNKTIKVDWSRQAVRVVCRVVGFCKSACTELKSKNCGFFDYKTQTGGYA